MIFVKFLNPIGQGEATLAIREEEIGRAYGIIYISSSCTDVRAECS